MNQVKRKTKVKRKWKRSINKVKKLRIGTRAVNLGMFIIGWFLVVGIAVMYVRGFGMKTIISNDSMVPTFQEDEVLKINQFIYKITSPKRMDTVAVRMGETKSGLLAFRVKRFRFRMERSMWTIKKLLIRWARSRLQMQALPMISSFYRMTSILCCATITITAVMTAVLPVSE